MMVFIVFSMESIFVLIEVHLSSTLILFVIFSPCYDACIQTEGAANG